MLETTTNKENDKNNGKLYKLACRSCNAVTNHKVLTSIVSEWNLDEIDISGMGVFETVECQGCNSLSFRIASSNSEGDHFYNEETQEVEYETNEELYPNRIAGRKEIENTYLLPPEILKIYRETHKAFCSKIKILAGIGIRALVESVCKEKKARGSSLEKKIDDLVNKGLLTKDNANALHATRLLGNKLAHEIIESNNEELEIAMDIVENLLGNVYIIPEKAKRLKVSLFPKNKKSK